MKKIFLCVILILGITSLSYSESIPLDKNSIRVLDGDTITVDIPGLPDVFGKRIGVRLLGIDTPEIHSKDTCIRDMAKISRDTLSAFLKSGNSLVLINVKRDKYFRLNADIMVGDHSAAKHMLAKNRAQAYNGKGPKPLWECQKDWFSPQP